MLVARNERSAFGPDVLVRCGPLGGRERLASGGKIVFEVLSPSTMRFHRGIEFDAYRRIEGIEQIVFVYRDSVRVESYFRNDDSWPDFPKELVGREDSLAISIIGASLGLDASYLDVVPSPFD